MIRKLSILGEVFSFEERYPLSEAIALEEGLGMTFGAWDQGLKTGSAKALAGYAWLVLKRNGRDVPLADILSGKFDLAISDITPEDGAGGDGPDPTEPDPPPSSDTSDGSTSGSSPTSSDTPPGSSTSSPSTSSTP